jgi:hypothetical protein
MIMNPADTTMATPTSICRLGISPNTAYPTINANRIEEYSKGATTEAGA